MGYVEQNLGTGERVVHRSELHWIIFLSLRALLTAFILPLIDNATSEFAVTNRRVIIKVGLIRRRTLELRLEKIESIGVDQSILGRLLGYGTITVHGTGGTHEPFPNIIRPLDFRKAVMNAAAASAGPDAPAFAAGSSSDGATKTCPYCAETVKAAARLCRFCGSDLTAPVQEGRAALE